MAHSSKFDGKPGEVFGSLTTLSTQHHRDNSREDQLSLFVFLREDDEFTDGEPAHVRHDISWLQFIDGLGVYIVFDVAHTMVDCLTDEPQGRAILVNKEGAIQNQWDAPPNEWDLDHIRQTIEQKIDEREVSR